MRPQISSEEAFYGLKASMMLSISIFSILKSIRFDVGSDQDFPHVAVDGRPAIYLFVYSLKESFVG